MHFGHPFPVAQMTEHKYRTALLVYPLLTFVLIGDEKMLLKVFHRGAIAPDNFQYDIREMAVKGFLNVCYLL